MLWDAERPLIFTFPRRAWERDIIWRPLNLSPSRKSRIPLQAQLKATAFRSDQLLKPETRAAVFLGRSNVGKSSFINALCKKEIAKVAKTPGKTRSVNYYALSDRLTLVDVPGYGYAKRSFAERESWQKLLEDFFDSLVEGALVYLLVDSKRELEEEELQLVDSLQQRNISVQLLMTKADRLNQSERSVRMNYLKNIGKKINLLAPLAYCFVSARTGEGVDFVRRQLFHYGQKD